MQVPNSPIFPPQQLTLSPNNIHALSSIEPQDHIISTYIPQLPDKPLASTAGISVYIIPAEKNLYVQGFQAQEYSERPPTLLRGCLYLRVSKPSKIKSITLTFKGSQRTEWPEGIPPKKNQFSETTDIINHTWPFLQPGSNLPNNGADVYRELPNSVSNEHDVSHLSLGETRSRGASPLPPNSGNELFPTITNASITTNNNNNNNGNFLTRSLSPATNFMRRATSPSVSSMDGPPDLTAVLSPSTTNTNSNSNVIDESRPTHFQPGDYIYNFEHPLQPSIPESCNVTFGSVSYSLETSVIRPGTFKSNLIARIPIEIIRTPAEQNLEENESIVITRDWEDQLKYDIVVGSKSIVLDSYLPLAFRFVPLFGKVSLHRIRVYLTENLEYFCRNKKVHRLEPSRKFLLLEHKAEKGKSLLTDVTSEGHEGNDEEFVDLLPKELEFQVYVPKVLNGKTNHEIHPDTSYDNIQSHHWIKICLRISRLDPENPEKRKHYEISIDSPLHVLSPLAAHGNTLLPAYDDFISRNDDNTINYEISPPNSPGVIPIDNTTHHHTNQSFLAVYTPTNAGSSLDEVMQRRPRSASASPLPFHRLNSRAFNEVPVDNDADMHLEANLYKPEEFNPLLSPQAFPHPGTFTSPLNSPVQRPIHLIRRPSINPPAFDAETSPPPVNDIVAPPPAYEEEDPAMSLSPLRIDEAPSPSRSNSDEHTTTTKSTNNFNNNIYSTSETPVKALLQQQLRNSRPSLDSGHSSSKSNVSKKSLDSSTSLNSSNSANNHTTTTNNNNNNMVPSGSNLLTIPADDEQDITDYPSSPILPPRTLSPRRVFENDQTNDEEDEQGDSFAPNSGSGFQTSSSRRTSVSSYTSTGTDIQPVEQTIPLLSLSNASIATNLAHSDNYYQPQHAQARNASLSSLLNEGVYFRRGSQVTGLNSTKINEFIEGGDLGDDMFKINGNLSHLRNPRIKKHYQEGEHISSFVPHEEESSQHNAHGEEEVEDQENAEDETIKEEESDSTDANSNDSDTTSSNKVRQKSFGVIQTPTSTSQTSEEVESLEQEFIHSHGLQHDGNKPTTNTDVNTNGIPGFNFSYVIE
ncbi:hypothetical protein DFJ63DRAFT_284434 [Scheffersomyces coipomensis]|uniref:uncharacterized protein n=1 Tax=Scheffersomyces coipomensis TaxID=1788519 RepID=UPI00315DBDCA